MLWRGRKKSLDRSKEHWHNRGLQQRGANLFCPRMGNRVFPRWRIQYKGKGADYTNICKIRLPMSQEARGSPFEKVSADSWGLQVLWHGRQDLSATTPETKQEGLTVHAHPQSYAQEMSQGRLAQKTFCTSASQPSIKFCKSFKGEHGCGEQDPQL